MTSHFTWEMRAAAVGWLRYERGCYLVCWERSPWETAYRPDLIGVNSRRKVIEVEFKQSLADFKANESKRHLIQRVAFGYAPSQFYFAVPRSLVESVKPFLPAGSSDREVRSRKPTITTVEHPRHRADGAPPDRHVAPRLRGARKLTQGLNHEPNH